MELYKGPDKISLQVYITELYKGSDQIFAGTECWGLFYSEKPKSPYTNIDPIDRLVTSYDTCTQAFVCN